MRPTPPPGYRVVYRHLRDRVETRDGTREVLSPHGGTTIALLYRGDAEIPSARGFAFCNETDNFSKRIGRDIALGRALKDLAAQAPSPSPRRQPGKIRAWIRSRPLPRQLSFDLLGMGADD